MIPNTQRITSSPSSRNHAIAIAAANAAATAKPPMADYHLTNNRSPSLSPTQQPLQQPSSFDAQNAISHSSPSSSHLVPLTTLNLIASNSALDLNVGGASLTNVAAAGTTLPASSIAVKQTSTPPYSNLLGNSTSVYLTSSSTTNANRSPLSAAANTTTFDYLYEFSETRKVLEDFFKCPNTDEDKKINDCFNESDTGSFVSSTTSTTNAISFIHSCFFVSLELYRTI